MSELILTITGNTGSGKRSLMYLIKKFLIENGFDVDFKVNFDFIDEQHFDEEMSKKIDQTIEYVKNTKTIVIHENYPNRHGIVMFHINNINNDEN